MAWKDPKDPRDPWAWRNTWTGEIRNDYSELWIVITLIVMFVIAAFLCLLPLLIHAYCRSACPCPSFWSFFDRFLQVLHELGRKSKTPRDPESFVNPAFDPTFIDPTLANNNLRKPHVRKLGPENLSHLRHSVRTQKSSRLASINRSKSCPPRPIVPRIKIPKT
uniref:Small integral membrane protein 3-like n=1 Tax=Panagrellus redivivus TaxID=6233 RepID=A0A7E4VAU5_PANRE